MLDMFSYSKAAMERMMKVQEVLLRAMARKITWFQAAEILGFTDRHLRRMRERYQEFGYDGLFDRRRGKPSPKRVPLATVEAVLGLYREKYFDLNVRHFHEKLKSEHQIGLSYSWVKAALQGAGLVGRQRQRGVHRKRRPRRPLPGMLLHIDGSHHQWFQDERWYDLIVILDDATSEIYYAQLSEHYMAEFNARFQVPAAQRGSAFVRRSSRDLDLIFALQFDRTVNRDNTVSIQNLRLQIEAVRWRATLAGCTVTVHQHLDGTFTITHGPQRLGHYSAEGVSLEPAKIGARRAVEKTRGGKVINPTFPPRLEIPQTPRDSHFPTASTAAGD